MMDKQTLTKLNQFKKVVRDSVSPDSKFILFGSYATGKYTEASDIDIAVIMPEVGDVFDQDVVLRKKAIPIDPRIVPLVFSEQDYNEKTPLTLQIHEQGVPL